MIDRLAFSAFATLSTVLHSVFGPPEPDDDQRSDRGDVPGWVMITVMTAIVVIALLAVFREEVINAVKSAFQKVNDSGTTK